MNNPRIELTFQMSEDGDLMIHCRHCDRYDTVPKWLDEKFKRAVVNQWLDQHMKHCGWSFSISSSLEKDRG